MSEIIRIVENHKATLGKLIAYYRKINFSQTNSSRFNTDNFNYDTQGIMICSRNQLFKILKGEPIEDYEIYHKLLENLGMKYKYDPKFYEYLKKTDRDLLKAAEFHDVERIKTLVNYILPILKKHHNYIILHEYAILYQAILNYYVDNEVNQEDVDYLNSTREYATIDQIPIIIDIIQFYYNFKKHDIVQAKEILHYAGKIKSSNILLKFNIAASYYRGTDFLNAFNLFEEIKEVAEKEKNIYYLTKIYNAMGAIQHFYDKKVASMYFEKTIELLISQNNISNLPIAYVNHAINYFEQENYEDTLKYLYLSIEMKPVNALIYIIFLFHCNEKLKRDIHTPQIEEMIQIATHHQEEDHEIFKVILTYYRNRFYGKDIENIKKIMNDLLNSAEFLLDNILYYEILRDDIGNTCLNNKKYANYFNFLNKMEAKFTTIKENKR